MLQINTWYMPEFEADTLDVLTNNILYQLHKYAGYMYAVGNIKLKNPPYNFDIDEKTPLILPSVEKEMHWFNVTYEPSIKLVSDKVGKDHVKTIWGMIQYT